VRNNHLIVIDCAERFRMSRIPIAEDLFSQATLHLEMERCDVPSKSARSPKAMQIFCLRLCHGIRTRKRSSFGYVTSADRDIIIERLLCRKFGPNVMILSSSLPLKSQERVLMPKGLVRWNLHSSLVGGRLNRVQIAAI